MMLFLNMLLIGSRNLLLLASLRVLVDDFLTTARQSKVPSATTFLFKKPFGKSAAI